MTECLFCRIANRTVPSQVIYEDQEHLGFLDILQNTKGQAVVITKKHFGSDPSRMPKKAYREMHLAAQKVMQLLNQALNPARTCLIIEGMEIDHIHVKLFPVYPGHHLGEFVRPGTRASEDELADTAALITGSR